MASKGYYSIGDMSMTEEEWLTIDPILGFSEVAYVSDKRSTKHGNGTSKFSELPYDSDGSSSGSTLADYGITDAYTKEEINKKFGGIFNYKGTITANEINNVGSSPEIGDVYNIIQKDQSADCEYFNFDVESTGEETDDNDGEYFGSNYTRFPLNVGLYLLILSWGIKSGDAITITVDDTTTTNNIYYNSMMPTLQDTAGFMYVSDTNSSYLNKKCTISFNMSVKNGDNIAYTQYGWDRLSSYIDLSKIHDSIDSKADKQTADGGFAGGENAETEGGFAGGHNATSTSGGAVGQSAYTSDGFAGGYDTQSSYGGAAGKDASTYDGGAVGFDALSYDGGAVGCHTQASNGGAVGNGAGTSDGFAGGKGAKTMKADGDYINAIQLGEGTNENEYTAQVYDYQLLADDAETKSVTDGSKYLKDVGKLSDLYTTNKDDVVSAINEVNNYVSEKLDKQSDEYGFKAGRNSSARGSAVAVGIDAKAIGGGIALGSKSNANYMGVSIGYNSNANIGSAVGYDAKETNGGGAIGQSASVGSGGAIGNNAISGDGFAGGNNAKTINSGSEPIDAIQLGQGTNENEYTAQVYDYQLLADDSTSKSATDGGKYLKDVGKLSDLVTDNKENIVSAINEVKNNSGGSASSNTTGKVTTNGFIAGNDISASDGVAIGKNATINGYGVAIGKKAGTNEGVSIGDNSFAGSGVALGEDSRTGGGFAAGYKAKTVNSGDIDINAVQLGTGTNANEYSMQIYDYQLLADDSTSKSATDGCKYLKDVGKLSDLTTTNKDDVVSAINEVKNNVDSRNDLITATRNVAEDVDSRVGKLTDLSTTNKENIISAINEVKSSVGKIKYEVTTSTIENLSNEHITINMTNGEEFRYTKSSGLGTLTLTLPIDITDDDYFASSVIFKSGSTATVFDNQPVYLKMMGDDCSNTLFTPVANKKYFIEVKYDGEYYYGIVRSYAI